MNMTKNVKSHMCKFSCDNFRASCEQLGICINRQRLQGKKWNALKGLYGVTLHAGHVRLHLPMS